MNIDLPQPLPWMRSGLCAQTDPALFYPEEGGPAYEAQRICTLCEVRAACREYALEHETRGTRAWGIWAGMTVKERRRELRKRGLLHSPRQVKETAA